MLKSLFAADHRPHSWRTKWAWKASELPTGTAGFQHEAERSKGEPSSGLTWLQDSQSSSGFSSLGSLVLQHLGIFFSQQETFQPARDHFSKLGMPSQGSVVSPSLLPQHLLLGGGLG